MKLFYERPLFHAALLSGNFVYELLVNYSLTHKIDPIHDYAGHYALNLLLFYFTVHVVYPYGWGKMRSVVLVAILYASALGVYLLIKKSMLLGFDYFALDYYNPYQSPKDFLLLSFFRANTFFFMGSGYWFADFSIKKILKMQEMKFRDERMLSELRITNLLSRINPHFFFNTLSSLHIMALQKSDKLPDTILELADISEYSFKLDEVNVEVGLQEEVRNLKRHIHLYELGYGDLFKLEFVCEGEIGDQQIPRLLLISIAENLFKYGDLTNAERPARIDVSASTDTLNFRTFNIKKRNTLRGHGSGLETLRKRLSIYFPGNYSLAIKDEGQSFELNLELTFKRNQHEYTARY